MPRGESVASVVLLLDIWVHGEQVSCIGVVPMGLTEVCRLYCAG